MPFQITLDGMICQNGLTMRIDADHVLENMSLLYDDECIIEEYEVMLRSSELVIWLNMIVSGIFTGLFLWSLIWFKIPIIPSLLSGIISGFIIAKMTFVPLLLNDTGSFNAKVVEK